MEIIYLDYNSTTPVDPRVLESMLPWFTQQFGNAGSTTHYLGLQAAKAVEDARMRIADCLHCEPSEIIFTSGSTESVNLAMRGAMRAYAGSGNHFVIAAGEHKSVLDTANALVDEGNICTIVNIDREGRIDLKELENAIRKDTVFVSVMMANNETGVLQDVEAIGRICRDKNVLFISDTTQAVGKIQLDVKENTMAMACFSAHKIYGPKGVGALYVSRKNPRVQLHPIITGGGQERGVRSGTLNVPGIVGMGIACEIAMEESWENSTKISSLRTILEQRLEMECGAKINGRIKDRIPNTSNLRIPGVAASKLIAAVPMLAFSTGSACTSALPQPSHVLKAMGLNDQEASESFRLSLGITTTDAEVNVAVQQISAAVTTLTRGI